MSQLLETLRGVERRAIETATASREQRDAENGVSAGDEPLRWVGLDLYRLTGRRLRVGRPRPLSRVVLPTVRPDATQGGVSSLSAARPVDDSRAWRSMGRAVWVHGVLLSGFLLVATLAEEPGSAVRGQSAFGASASTSAMACVAPPSGKSDALLASPSIEPVPAIRESARRAGGQAVRVRAPVPSAAPVRTGRPAPVTMASIQQGLPMLEGSVADSALIRSVQQPARYLFLTRNPAAMTRARQALLAGDLERARRLYEQRLSSEPQQLQALAGLAAVAVRMQQPERARALYQEMARLDPRMALARLGLRMLDAGVSGQQPFDSRLEQQAGGSRDLAGALHFVKGVELAARQDWPGAREAFRAALPFKPANPDLQFNLAVALDRSGEHRPALEHYRQALRVRVERGWAGFDPARVRQRVAILEAYLREG